MNSKRHFCLVWLACFGVFVVLPWVFAMAAGYALDPSMRNPYADRMQTACDSGDTKALQSALRQGADVNAPVWEDETPLIRASMFGRLGILEALLAAGANVNAESSHGSALMMANSCLAKDAPKIAFLLRHADAKK